MLTFYALKNSLLGVVASSMEPQMTAADSLASKVANYMEASENWKRGKRREREDFWCLLQRTDSVYPLRVKRRSVSVGCKCK